MRRVRSVVILDMCMTEIAAYGTWKSPISAADVARGAVSVAFPAVAGDEVWWQESRPAEGGRVTIMAAAGGGAGPRGRLPAPRFGRNRGHAVGRRGVPAGAGRPRLRPLLRYLRRPGAVPVGRGGRRARAADPGRR